MKTLAAAACALLGALAPAAALEGVFAAKLDAYGGPLVMNGRGSALSGSAAWSASPGVALSPRDLLIPTVSGAYRRTRDIREFAGGGSLTTETLDNAASLRWARRLGGDWALKPNLSYANSLVATSADRALGAGLFDSRRLGAGLEAERRGERTWRHAVSAYAVRYYHYRPSISPAYGLELRSGGGALDFDAWDYRLSAERGDAQAPRRWSAWGLASYRRFPNQPLVDAAGSFETRRRRDVLASLGGSVQRTLPRLRSAGGFELRPAAGLGLSASRLDSNQNGFDSIRAVFSPDYYSYAEFSGSASLSAAAGERWSASLFYERSRRDYARRPAQAADGRYVPRRVGIDTDALSCGVSYALSPGFSLNAVGAYRSLGSNMRYEGAYRYNYAYSYYLLGFGYSL